jgi:hypothetical protein
MQHMIRKLAIGLASVPLATGLSVASVGAASASTPACSGAASGQCGAQVNTSGNAMNVRGGVAAVNTKIIAFPDSTTDPHGDFQAAQTTSNVNERTFQYDPKNVLSNPALCISEPSTAVNSGLVLRACRAPGNVNAKFQEFTGVNTQNTNGTQWKNVASGLIVQANGTSHQLSAVRTVTNPGGTCWGFNAPGSCPS